MSPDVDPQAFPRYWTWPFVPVHYALLMTCTLSSFVCFFFFLALLPFLLCLLCLLCPFTLGLSGSAVSVLLSPSELTLCRPCSLRVVHPPSYSYWGQIRSIAKCHLTDPLLVTNIANIANTNTNATPAAFLSLHSVYYLFLFLFLLFFRVIQGEAGVYDSVRSTLCLHYPT